MVPRSDTPGLRDVDNLPLPRQMSLLDQVRDRAGRVGRCLLLERLLGALRALKGARTTLGRRLEAGSVGGELLVCLLSRRRAGLVAAMWTGDAAADTPECEDIFRHAGGRRGKLAGCSAARTAQC